MSLRMENNSLAMKTLDKNHDALNHLDPAIIEQVTDLGQDIQNSETCKRSVSRSNLELPVKIAMESGDNRNQLDEVCNFRQYSSLLSMVELNLEGHNFSNLHD